MKMMIFLLNMMIFLLKMMIFPFKIVIFPLNMVIFQFDKNVAPRSGLLIQGAIGCVGIIQFLAPHHAVVNDGGESHQVPSEGDPF